MAGIRGLLNRRAKGSTVTPNVVPPSIVYSDTSAVGPGGGYGWGPGPRQWVGSRGPAPTHVEIGQPGDFVEGGDGEPLDSDLGFPHASRWPGYPPGWETPFYETSGGGSGPYGPYSGLAGPSGWGPRWYGGALLESRISTVFACTDLISRTLAGMKIMATNDSTPEPAPAWCENPEPEIYSSIVDAMKALVNSILLRGDGIVAPTARYADGTVARWVVLNPDVVQVENVAGLPQYSIEGLGIIPRAELLHLRYQVWPGVVRGVSPLDACASNLVSADALQRYGTQLATSNGIPTAVLQSAAKLTKPQAGEIKRSWMEAALSRGVLPVVLSGGLTYQPLNLKPSDIGLLDLRSFDEQRVIAAFGVPPWLVGMPMDSRSLTYSTVAGQFDYFWRATLNALSYNIMQGLSGWAMPRGHWVRHDSESLVRPDILGRAQSYQLLIGSGVVTPNEARAWENLAPLPEPAAPPLPTAPTQATANSSIVEIQGTVTGGI